MFQAVTTGEMTEAGVVVAGIFSGESAEMCRALMPRKAGWADGAVAAGLRAECKGEAGKIAEFFPEGGSGGTVTRVIVVGLGKLEKCTMETVRSAAASVARRLAVTRDERAMICLSAALERAGIDVVRGGQAIGEAFGLLAWDNTTFKGTAGGKSGKDGKGGSQRPSVELGADKKGLLKGIERGLGLGVAVNMARTLSETPPNVATPSYIADQARALGKATGMKVTVMAGKDLEKERLEGHINVGKASENKPCMIRIEYVPEKVGRKKDKPMVLIGKTMTYDTGGLSLKVNNGMVGMKRDKDGGCAVLGAMHAIATMIKPDRRVVAFLCSAENSLSDEAYRPDDVITYRNGVTVEVTNTDAEGRLVLADAFCYACDKEDPAFIVELSTLTGGVVTALGSTYCGMFCDDDGLRARVEAAAATSGERVWRLPLHQEYKDMMKSPIADILNSNPNRKAHAGQGAAFLSYFVKEGVPWCHLDIAGVHVSESDSGMFVKGSNGWGVRILAALLEQE